MLRPAYVCLGFGFLILAGIGAVVPLMPSTVFCILALWAFKKSNPRMEKWLLEHPVVGPTLRDWELHRSIRRKTKVSAISLLWIALGFSWFFVSDVSRIILPIVGIGVSTYIWTRKTTEEQSPSVAIS